MSVLKFMKRIIDQSASNSLLAKAFWRPTQIEKNALTRHNYVEDIGRVDQVWEWLSKNHGDVLAVDAPHASIPESYTYKEIAELISKVASGFESFGIGSGDVVAIFAENSPRWLVADQGLMRAGGINAVRGATAPTAELRYIIEDSGSKALIVQSAELWEKL